MTSDTNLFLLKKAHNKITNNKNDKENDGNLRLQSSIIALHGQLYQLTNELQDHVRLFISFFFHFTSSFI